MNMYVKEPVLPCSELHLLYCLIEHCAKPCSSFTRPGQLGCVEFRGRVVPLFVSRHGVAPLFHPRHGVAPLFHSRHETDSMASVRSGGGVERYKLPRVNLLCKR